jgi:two-component system LytT family sensor kinase
VPGRTTWIWISSLWLGLGLFDASQTLLTMHAQGMHHPWLRLFFTVVAGYIPWALATPLVLYLGRNYPLIPVRLTNWLRHVAACLGIALVVAGVAAGLEVLLNPWGNPAGPGSFLASLPVKVGSGLLGSLVLYAFIIIVTSVLDAKQRLAAQQAETARMNEQLMKAQLEALRRQIEPHFLFNTLNAISGLVRENRGDDATHMIAELSEFLRQVMGASARHQVSLAEEIEFVDRYVAIQKVRLVDRLQFVVSVPPELLTAQVPSFLLQPVVENAIVHGIAKRVQAGSIRISAARDDGTLTLVVYNDGPALPGDSNAMRSGIGIANLRERLRTLYGPAFTVSMTEQSTTGMAVSISLPFRG